MSGGWSRFLLTSWYTWVSRLTSVRWRYSSHLLHLISLSIYFGTCNKGPWRIQRIADYAQRIVFNLCLPQFLARDILLGDLTWVLTSLQNISLLQLKELIGGPMAINQFTDANPHCAAILPSIRLSMLKVFSILKKLKESNSSLCFRATHAPPKSFPCSKFTNYYYGTSHLAIKYISSRALSRRGQRPAKQPREGPDTEEVHTVDRSVTWCPAQPVHQEW